MAAPAVTYTFSNSTTADATQVNTNQTDTLACMTDGLKDFSILTLAVASTSTLNGNVTIGSASSKDLTVNASLASSIPIKTTFSYDIGSNTLGLRDIYLGSADSAARSTKIRGATIASAYTLTTPTTGGTANFAVITDGSGTLSYLPFRDQIGIYNCGIATSVAASALTISLKGADGNAPSSTNPVYVGFRHATITTGTPSFGSATAATTLVISSGSTLGLASSSVTEWVYVYAINNAGTIELAAMGGAGLVDEGSVTSTTAEGGAGAADTRYTLYSTSARSDVAARLLCRIKFTLATAGTWGEAGDEIALPPFGSDAYRSEVVVHTGNGHGSTNTKIRIFTTAERNVGSAITYATAANNGDSFTINHEGIYAMSYSDKRAAGGSQMGISLNTTGPTNAFFSIAESERIIGCQPATAAFSAVAATTRLSPGDVIRAHTDGTCDGTEAKFRIIKVAE